MHQPLGLYASTGVIKLILTAKRRLLRVGVLAPVDGVTGRTGLSFLHKKNLQSKRHLLTVPRRSV